MARAERLGVVIPTLEEELLLPALLERLAHGAGPGDSADEVVVADGGSLDRTVELARAAGARVIEAPAGRGAQLAAGAQATTSELLLFLHADCVPAPGALARLREAFEREALVWGALQPQVEASGRFYRLVEGGAAWRLRFLATVLGDCGLAVRSEDYRAVGGFADLPLLEDVELSRRLRRRGRPRLVRGAVLRISPRRWRREGALRGTLRNWMILAAYALGADPRSLARLYPIHPRTGPRP